MTSETRTPAEIEREIETQRSDLTSNLEDLQDKFSIDTLVRQVSDQFREHGGDIGKSITDQVKANPIPLALTGIGLAWMMFGNGQKPAAARGYTHAEEEFRRSRLDQGRPYTPPVRSVSEYDTGPSYGTVPSWAREDRYDGPSMTDRVASRAGDLKDNAAYGAKAVRDGASSAASSASDSLSAAGEKVSDAASSARSSLEDGAKSVQSSMAAARERIAQGTEDLTEEGRRRVIEARQRALEMRRQAAQSLHQGTDAAADFYDRQPLVIGALALAVGAALGGALPRTKVEDDLMGRQSDDLFDEAERIYEEEKSKAMKVAQSVKNEVEDIAKETKSDLDSGAPGDKTAAQAVADKAKSAATRVADAAKDTAEDENLGKPKT
ncbi:DUF3618 domain-containing protein [Oceaniglobus ichthyenteri]|uniref:DUF3618 domain-containing protein n=1 Tax=Oceaniglobus ichthyenteri TaxID=2136177 RepID=UPI0013DE1E3A|nr:DUF3618 domain-containing protein [Oceaniglobus ichthyenteri]